MTTPTFEAVLLSAGGWHLYVVTPGDSADWPEVEWPRGSEVPTLARRVDALADLGFAPEGDRWQWSEQSHADSGDTLWLLATVLVRPTGGGAG